MLHAGVQTYEVCLPESEGGGVAHSLTYRHSDVPEYKVSSRIYSGISIDSGTSPE